MPSINTDRISPLRAPGPEQAMGTDQRKPRHPNKSSSLIAGRSIGLAAHQTPPAGTPGPKNPRRAETATAQSGYGIDRTTTGKRSGSAG